MRKVLSVLLITLSYVVFSQKTCDKKKEDVLEDLNSISITKCTIESSKKAKSKRARRISVRVSAPKRRYLKKRVVAKKDAVSSINNLNTSGVASVESSSEISKTLILRKSVANLTNKLSAEEVRSASKFIAVDEIPTFKSCKSASKEDALDCFNTEMIKHIQEHFSYPSEAVIKKIEGNVWVRFVIDKNGDVTNIKALGPKNGELLKLEAKRVASKLPKFSPALKGGKTVAVKYGFPINFSLEQ